MLPLQVYHSAIVFAPEQSVVRRTFQAQFPIWIALPPKVELDWDACIQTLEGHANPVNSVAFSHDSKTLASASYDSTIKLWDVATGACTATLKGHTDSVTSLAFDTTGSSLYTNAGTFTLNNLSLSATTSTATPAPEISKEMPNPVPQQVNRRGIGLSEDNAWVTWDSHKVLWLPPTYRPGTSVTTTSRVAIGCPSGRVLLLTFSFSHDF